MGVRGTVTAHRASEVGGRLPDFLVLGAPKSGTTSLAAWLDAHPDVFIPAQKELSFFTRDDRWGEGPASYAREFADAGTRRLAGEATPNYLANPVAAERLVSVVPDARLIAILREPVDRAWSHHCYDRDLEIDTTPFDEIVASAGRSDEHRHVREGRYVRHLERYAALVPRDQLLVLWFDDLRDRPEDTWRSVCRFLELRPDPVPKVVGSVHNRHYRVRFPWVRQAMLRGQAWKRLPFGLAPRIDRLIRDEQPNDALPDDLRDQLRAAYAADDRALAAWMEQPLPAGWAR